MKWIKTIIATILIIISLILIFNKHIASFLLALEPNITVETINKAKNKEELINYNDVTTATSWDVINSKLNYNVANFIGLVSVPSISLKQPIANELSNYTLSVGAAIYYKDMKMGGMNNYVLASHFSYMGETQLFSPLYYNIEKNLLGEKIFLTDLSKVYTYKITKYSIVREDETEHIEQSNDRALITLFTCNYSHEYGRIILQGELDEIRDVKELEPNYINEIF